MKYKYITFIIGILILIIIFVGCNSVYNNLISEYNSLYKDTVNSLNQDKIYESIKDSNANSKLEQLENLIYKIEKEVPNNKLSDYLGLKGKHEILKGIIEKGMKWNNINDSEKRLLKDHIRIIKSGVDS